MRFRGQMMSSSYYQHQIVRGDHGVGLPVTYFWLTRTEIGRKEWWRIFKSATPPPPLLACPYLAWYTRCAPVHNVTHACMRNTHWCCLLYRYTVWFLEIHFTMMSVLSVDSIAKTNTFVCVRNVIKPDKKSADTACNLAYKLGSRGSHDHPPPSLWPQSWKFSPATSSRIHHIAPICS